MTFKNITIAIIIFIVLIGWLILFFSSSGILVYGESPKIKSGNGQETIECIYFTGTGFIHTNYWYSPNGILGRPACPRIVDI